MLFGISLPAWGPWESLSQQSQVACPSCLKLSSVEFQLCGFKVSWLWSVTSLKVKVYRSWGKKVSRKEKCVWLSFSFVALCVRPIVSFDPSLKLVQSFSKILTQTLSSHLTLKSASGNIHLPRAPLLSEVLFVLPSSFLWSPLNVTISGMMIKHRPTSAHLRLGHFLSCFSLSAKGPLSLQRAKPAQITI